MRIKPLLVSTAFISTLFATTALVPDALAQKGFIYTPATDWAVSKVDGQGAGSAYCALARRFQKNTILTIAKNMGDEASLALDFQRPKFQVGQSVQVVLDPGAGQQRSYNTTPASSNAFVVRLGRDDAFFSALEKTGYLRAEIGSNTYNFNLADIDAGQSNLNACIVSMTQPAAGEAFVDEGVQGFTPPPTFGGSAGNSRMHVLEVENENLRLKLAAMKNGQSAGSGADVSRLQAENAKLQSSLNLVQGNATAARELQSEVATLRAQNDKLKALTAGAVDEGQRGLVVSLTDENRRLQQELDKLSTAMPAEVTPSTVTARLAVLEDENAKLRRAVEQGQDKPARVDESLKQEVVALRSENARLQQDLSAAAGSTPDMSVIEGQLTALREENARLKGQLTMARQDVQASYEDKLRHYEFENNNLRAALDGQGDDNVDLVAQLRAQLDQIKSENRLLQDSAAMAREQASADKQAEIEELKQKLAYSGTDVDETARLQALLDKAVKERNSYKQAAKAQNQKISSLEAEIGAALAQSSDAAALSEKMAALDVENQQLKSEIELAAKEVETQATAQIAMLEEKNETLAREIERYSDQAEALQIAKADIAALRGEKEGLVQELASLSENQGLDATALKEVLAQNDVLKSEVEEKVAALQTLAELDVKLKTMAEENQALQSTIEEQNIQLAAAIASEETIASLKDENQALQLQVLASADSAGAPSMEMSAAAEEKIATLGKENEALKHDLTQARGEIERVIASAEAAKQAAPAAQQLASAEIPAASAPVSVPAPQSKPSAPKPAPAAQKVADLQDAVEREETTQASAMADDIADDMATALNEMMPAAGDERADTGPAPEEILAAGGQETALHEQEIEARDDAPSEAIDVVDVLEAPVSEPVYTPGLSEAQRLEQSLMNQIDEGAQPIAAAPAPAPAVVASQSADPFADIDVEQPDLPEVGVVEALPEVAMADSAVEEELNDIIEQAAAADSVSAAAQAEAMEIEEQAQIARAAIEGAPETLEEEHIAPVSTSGAFAPSFTMANMLSQASIAAEAMSLVEKASTPERVVHQWSTQSIYGSSEQKPLRNADDFENNVRDYLTKTESRCQGDFAIVPDGSTQKGDTRMDSYEVACVGAGADSSASLLFFNKEGTFTVVAHEAPTEHMDTAMAVRDKLLHSVSGS